MNTAPARRRDRRWIPFLAFGLALLVTAIAAGYMRGVVRRQSREELRVRDTFVAAMERIEDELNGPIAEAAIRLRNATPRGPGELRDLTSRANARAAGDTLIRFATPASLDASGENPAIVGAIRTVFRWPRTGDSALIGRPTLGPHLGGPDQAFLIFLPIYADRLRTADPDEPVRPAGVLYSTLQVADLARQLDTTSLRSLRIRLYRARDTAATDLMYDSRGVSARAASGPPLRVISAINVLGAPWTLRLDARPGFGLPTDLDPVPTVLIAGTLLALVVLVTMLARARARREAGEIQSRYVELFSGTPVPMLLVDLETHALLDVNNAAVEQYGRTRDELHALTLNDLHADDDAPALLAQITAAGDSYLDAGAWRHRTSAGDAIDVAIAAHPIQFNDRPCALIAAHDLTAQRRADTAMRESEERLRQMANHIQEAFFIVDLPDWQPVYVSATWAEIWGRPMSEASDPAVWIDTVHPDDRDLLKEAQTANRKGLPAVTVFRVTRPDGVLRWVRGRTFPVRDNGGIVYRVVGVAEDITDLRSAEARLAQSQKMEAVGRLAGGVAHDFNNLLTVILGEVDQLSSELDSETPEAGSVAEIRGAAERAAALTRQLLAFSRRQIIAPTVFDLTASVTGLGNMLRRLIGENIDLVMRLAPDTWNPIADPGQIEQVLANLVVNARDAMPAGGTLTVETGNVTLDGEYPWQNADVQPGDYVVMTVSDTGTGMTPEVRARLFEPFFTTKAQGKGTGLGLATCYGILKQAGGHLSVYSEPDLGTTVKVYLPRGVAPAEQPEDEARPMLPRGDETILLVEDEAAVRRIAARLLQSQGYTLLQAQNGAEAAEVITSHPGTIDLLLTDVVLPGMGGRQIAEHARAQRPGIRVLFTSGYTDDLILQHRLVEHHVALLPKPFSRESIARKVREVLDAPEAVPLEV